MFYCFKVGFDTNMFFAFQTSVHELFHALGFSVDFFGRFKKCRLSGNIDFFFCVVNGLGKALEPCLENVGDICYITCGRLLISVG